MFNIVLTILAAITISFYQLLMLLWVPMLPRPSSFSFEEASFSFNKFEL